MLKITPKAPARDAARMLYGLRLSRIWRRLQRQAPVLPFSNTIIFSKRLRNTRIFLLGTIIGALFTTLFLLIVSQVKDQVFSASSQRKATANDNHVLLFISVGSAPRNRELRDAARSTYLNGLDGDSVSYRFFTDEDVSRGREDHLIWDNVVQEVKHYEDVVQMHGIHGGYGTADGNVFGLRGLWQMRWALDEYSFDYYLRIDDDSYLCLQRLLFELKDAPRKNLFWGRFWCRPGRNRADESFMLWSRNVVEWIVENGGENGLVPWDNDVTLGWNWGYWSWLLNLTIIDDAKGIDSQQGYLTNYMHGGFDEKHGVPVLSEKVGDFCDRFLFAHHIVPDTIRKVHIKAKRRLLYRPRQVRKGRACPSGDQSFLPGRHSKKLPQIHIQKDDAG